MKKIILDNEEYFTYDAESNDIVSSGFMTGEYILSKHIKCENFQVVFCPKTNEMLLIERQR